MFCWLGGVEVTHSIAVQDVPGSTPGSGKDFNVYFFVLLLWFLSKTHYLSRTVAIPFEILNYLNCFTYCQLCDRLKFQYNGNLSKFRKLLCGNGETNSQFSVSQGWLNWHYSLYCFLLFQTEVEILILTLYQMKTMVFMITFSVLALSDCNICTPRLIIENTEKHTEC